MTINTTIFDWSGVISDDFQAVYNSSMKIFDIYNRPGITADEFRDSIENPSKKFWQKMVPWARMDDVQRHFDILIRDEVRKPLPGAKDTLSFLNGKGISMYVVSSHPQTILEEEARSYGIYDYFLGIYGSNYYKDRRLARVVGDRNLDKNTTLFVEDMLEGLLAGKQIGIKTAALLSGYHSEERLRQANPDYIFQNITGLKTLFQ